MKVLALLTFIGSCLILTGCNSDPGIINVAPMANSQQLFSALTLAPKTPLDNLPNEGEVVISGKITKMYDGDEWILQDDTGTAGIFTNHQEPGVDEGDTVIVKGYIHHGLLETVIGSNKEVNAQIVALPNGDVYEISS